MAGDECHLRAQDHAFREYWRSCINNLLIFQDDVDCGDPPILNSWSLVTRFWWKATGILHLPHRSWQGQGGYPIRDEFWPLMKVASESSK